MPPHQKYPGVTSQAFTFIIHNTSIHLYHFTTQAFSHNVRNIQNVLTNNMNFVVDPKLELSFSFGEKYALSSLEEHLHVLEEMDQCSTRSYSKETNRNFPLSFMALGVDVYQITLDDSKCFSIRSTFIHNLLTQVCWH